MREGEGRLLFEDGVGGSVLPETERGEVGDLVALPV